MEKKLEFAKLPWLGYLTFCPSNLGTTMRASVHIKIPNLAAQANFKELCESLNLQPRGNVFNICIPMMPNCGAGKSFSLVCDGHVAALHSTLFYINKNCLNI